MVPPYWQYINSICVAHKMRMGQNIRNRENKHYHWIVWLVVILRVCLSISVSMWFPTLLLVWFTISASVLLFAILFMWLTILCVRVTCRPNIHVVLCFVFVTVWRFVIACVWISECLVVWWFVLMSVWLSTICMRVVFRILYPCDYVSLSMQCFIYITMMICIAVPMWCFTLLIVWFPALWSMWLYVLICIWFTVFCIRVILWLCIHVIQQHWHSSSFFLFCLNRGGGGTKISDNPNPHHII